MPVNNHPSLSSLPFFCFYEIFGPPPFFHAAACLSLVDPSGGAMRHYLPSQRGVSGRSLFLPRGAYELRVMITGLLILSFF